MAQPQAVGSMTAAYERTLTSMSAAPLTHPITDALQGACSLEKETDTTHLPSLCRGHTGRPDTRPQSTDSKSPTSHHKVGVILIIVLEAGGKRGGCGSGLALLACPCAGTQRAAAAGGQAARGCAEREKKRQRGWREMKVTNSGCGCSKDARKAAAGG